jgi:hypothetical protein
MGFLLYVLLSILSENIMEKQFPAEFNRLIMNAGHACAVD